MAHLTIIHTYLVIHKKDQYLSAHSFFFILVRIYRYKQLHIRYPGINCDKLISKFNVSFSGKHLVHSFEKDPNSFVLFCFIFFFKENKKFTCKGGPKDENKRRNKVFFF